MFCVVDITEDTADLTKPKKRKSALRKARRKEISGENFELSRVKADSYPPFYIFKLPSGMLTSDKAQRVFNAYKNRLIFPRCADLPQELASFAFTQERYARERMRDFAEKTLASFPKKPSIKNALIRDKNLVSADAVLSAVPKMEKIYADTDDEEGFLLFCEKAMDGYGAVIMRQSGVCDLRRFDLIVDIDGGALYYTPEQRQGTRSFKPDPPVIPDALKDALPAGTDYFAVAAAMYEIYGFALDND